MNRRLLSTGVGLGLLAAVATSSFGIVRDDEDNLEFIGYKECISGKDFKIEEVKEGKIYGNSREYRITKYFDDPWNECYNCPRTKYGHRRGCHMKVCNPTRFVKRSWKKFRKKQWKNKKQ